MKRQLLAVVLVAVVISSSGFSETESHALVFGEARATLVDDYVVRDIETVLVRYTERANNLLSLSVPGDFTQIFQERIVFDDVKNNFPPGFINKLSKSIMDNGYIASYSVLLRLDAGTHDFIFEGIDGKVILRVKRPKGYDPNWYSINWSEESGNAVSDTDFAAHCNIFSPHRIAALYRFVTPEANALLLKAEQAAQEAQLAAMPEPIMMAMGGGVGSITNFQFHSIEQTTNGAIELSIEWETGSLSTNGIDYFACTNLMVQNWQIIKTTNVNLSTNCYSWIDNSATNYARRFYDVWTLEDGDSDGLSDGRENRLHGTDANEWDTDGDGVGDGMELDDGTSPLDGNQPANIKGSITYSGLIHMGASITVRTYDHSTSTFREILMSEPGDYIFSKLEQDDYNVWVYVDQDADGNQNSYEPYMHYPSTVTVTGQVSGINMVITDKDDDYDSLPDWWEYMYFGNLLQHSSGDLDVDALSNLAEYNIDTNPTDIDTDDDKRGDATELDCGSDPLLPPAGYATYMGVTFVEDFATPEVVTGDLDGQNRWASSPAGQVVVQSGIGRGGSQAIELAAGSEEARIEHIVGAVGRPIVWIDFYSLVDLGTISTYRDHPDISIAPDHVVSVFTMDCSGDIYAYDGTVLEWEHVTATTGGYEGGVYHRYTVKQDYIQKTWDLYVNATLVKSGLGFRDTNVLELTRFSMSGTKGGGTRCDDLTIGTTKPNGIP